MSEFFGTGISEEYEEYYEECEEYYEECEEDQMKIMCIRKVLPKDIQDLIYDENIRELLKVSANGLETLVTKLLSEIGLNDTQQIESTYKAIKEIVYPSQTQITKINNITATSIDEREYIRQIKTAISYNTRIEIDDNLAMNLLKAEDENMRTSLLNSQLESVCIELGQEELKTILKDLEEIVNNYQNLCAKNLSKPKTGNVTETKDYIESEIYVTDPSVVDRVKNEFKQIFNCDKDLSADDVKQLLMNDTLNREKILLSFIEMHKIKNENSFFSGNKALPSERFLSFVDDMIIKFYKSQSNKEVTVQTDQIFSNQAVKHITNYLVREYTSGVVIDFANGSVFDEKGYIDKEVLDNRTSCFSLSQVNQMLKDGVLPSCLLSIKYFDCYIKYRALCKDISNSDCSCLCEQFIDFLYMDIGGGCLDKSNDINVIVPTFVQGLITKYIKNKRLNSLEKINDNPVISRLFFDKNGVLRDKAEINKLLGTDEKILESFMNASIDQMFFTNIINLPIEWNFSKDWLSKIELDHRYGDYSAFIDDLIADKKLKTFTLADLLENKNEKVKNLLDGDGKEIQCGDKKFKLTNEQISRTKVMKVIAQDLDIMKDYLDENTDRVRFIDLQKLFTRLFWFTDCIDQGFFIQLVTFLKEKMLTDSTRDLDDLSIVDDLKDILQNETLVYLFKNIKSDFVMSVLLNQLLGNYLQISTLTAGDFATIFIAFFENVKDNKNFDLDKFKNVFIKTFVAKTKGMKRKNCGAQNNDETVLQFVLSEISNINKLLKEENVKYIFDDESYFDICSGILETNSEGKNTNINAIRDLYQESMDSLVFDFLRGKFNLPEETKDEIVENNKNKNKNQVNSKDEDIKKEDMSQKKIDETQTNRNKILDAIKIVRKLPGISEQLLNSEIKINEMRENINEVKVNTNTDHKKNDKNANENQINVESKNNVKNNEIKREIDRKGKKINDNKKKQFISDGDYRTDEEINEMLGIKNQTKDQNKKQHVLTKEEEEKIKTNEMKLECIVDLYNIDKEIVKEIIELDTGNLPDVRKVLIELQTILSKNKNQNQKVQNSIKKCYTNQFLFGKIFTKIALMTHNETQKYEQDYIENNKIRYKKGDIIGFKSNYENLFKGLFDTQKDIDGNKKNVFDKKDIDYFWTIWKKRHAYFDKQISFAKIKFQIDNKIIYPDEEYEKQYSKGIIKARTNHNLDKEISRSKDSIELNNANLDVNVIKEIDLQVESSYAASFEIFFFGYLSVLKKTVMEVKDKFKKENLVDFQKCYIQKFLTWHRNNKNAESIKKQFLLDMYFFFNRNDGKTQNIFGEEVVNYFNNCMIKLFKVNKTNIKFDKKLEPLKSSTLDEIQTVELDQKEKLGLWFLEYLDPERIARERQNKFNEVKKLVLKQQSELKSQEKTKVVYFDFKTMARGVSFGERKGEDKTENKKIEKTNYNVNGIKISDKKEFADYGDKIEHDGEINLNEKDNNQKGKKTDENDIDDKNKNLIKDGIQEEKTKINKETKTDDLGNKKGKNEITNTNGNVKIPIKNEEIAKEMDIKNNNLQENQKKDDIENGKSKEIIKLKDNTNIDDNAQNNIENIKNNIKKQSEILYDKYDKNKNLVENEIQEERIEITNIDDNVKIPIELGHEDRVEKIYTNNNNPQDNPKKNDIEGNKQKETTEPKDNKNIDGNEQNNIEDIRNDIEKQSEILYNREENGDLSNKSTKGNKIEPLSNSIIANINMSSENNSVYQTDSKPTNDRNSKQSQNNVTTKINCLPNNMENEYIEHMSILYDLDTNIIYEIDSAISNLRFSQDFNFLLPLNQTLNKYDKQKEQKEKQIKRYYIDRFFDSDIFKTHMQELEFESVFDFSNQNVLNKNDIIYFWKQWKKTVLLHFDSQQFKSQKLNVNEKDFCFNLGFSPSKFHNIPGNLVNQINSSIKKFKYEKPEDFFRGYHMLFKSETKELINKNNEFGVQKYYIESFLIYHMKKGNIDTKFLRHVDFRFRGYLLKKQTVFNDEAIKYFYELLRKLLLENKENEIVKNQISDEINGFRTKNFEVSIETKFIEKQEAEKNCHNYKIAFWFSVTLGVLFGGAIYFWTYFSVLVFIAAVFGVFCFKKYKDNKTKISDLIESKKCLLSTNQIELYKDSVEADIVCDAKIDYFAKIQEDEKKRYDKILKARNNMFDVSTSNKSMPRTETGGEGKKEINKSTDSKE